MNYRAEATLNRLTPLLEGLGSWRRHAIWVGNGILDAYLTDEAATGWRVPKEASFLLKLPSMVEHYRWEEIIQEKEWSRIGITDSGFTRYAWKSHTALIAAWPGETLTGQDRWYEDACFHSERIPLDDGGNIALFSPAYLVATTLDMLPPFGADLRYSEAFARLVYLFAGRTELSQEISSSYYEVRQDIHRKIQALLQHPDLLEALINVLPQEEWYLSDLVTERMKLACQDRTGKLSVTEA